MNAFLAKRDARWAADAEIGSLIRDVFSAETECSGFFFADYAEGHCPFSLRLAIASDALFSTLALALADCRGDEAPEAALAPLPFRQGHFADARPSTSLVK